MTLLSICENVIRAKADVEVGSSRDLYGPLDAALEAANRAYDKAITPEAVKGLCEALELAIPHLVNNARYLRDMQAAPNKIAAAFNAETTARAALQSPEAESADQQGSAHDR